MDFGPQISEYADKTIGVYGGKFYPFHKGHLSFVLKAQALVDVLFVVVQYDEEHERRLLTPETNFEWVDPRTREAWISEELKDFPNIRVLSQYEHRSDAHMTDPLITETYRELHELVGGKIDAIFSNTHEYDAYFAKYLPQSKHVVLFEDEKVFDISATTIRARGVYATWDFLPRTVQRHYTQRVALVGIESSGKTYLSKMLATLHSTVAVPEYGRTYYDEKNSYSSVDTPLDYIDIAAGHCHLLNRAARDARKLLFVDTDLIYTQFFYEQSYGEKSPVLDAMIKAGADKIDRWIWLEPHNPHQLDGTRLAVDQEARDRNREHLLGLYQHYGVELQIVDEPERDARFQRCSELALELLHCDRGCFLEAR